MRTISWETYQFILSKQKLFNNATGGTTSDTSVDPNPKSDPNANLAPLASTSLYLSIAGLILGYLLIVYVVVLITKQLKYTLPTV